MKGDDVKLSKIIFTGESLQTFIDEVKKYTDAEISALVNSAPETLDTLGELAVAFESNQDMVEILDAAITKKQDATTRITSAASSLVLSDNSEYYLTNVSSLTLSYPEGSFEAWMSIAFSTTETISVIFPSETKYIGAAPTFNKGETWEISIKDGVAICWRVK